MGTDRVHAGLHHGWFWDQTRDGAGDEALQQVDVRRVRLVVSVIRVRFRAHVVTHLYKIIDVLSTAEHFHNLNTNNPFKTLVTLARIVCCRSIQIIYMCEQKLQEEPVKFNISMLLVII